MTSSIVVKVGKRSTIRFSNTKVHRAVNVDELVRIVALDTNCHIVVIENITEDEEEQTRDFITDFLSKDTNNTVLFYLPHNDDTTSGLADEFDMEIYMSLGELYNQIYNKFGMYTSIYAKDRKAANAKKTNDVDDIFGALGVVGEETPDENEETSDKDDLTINEPEINVDDIRKPEVNDETSAEKEENSLNDFDVTSGDENNSETGFDEDETFANFDETLLDEDNSEQGLTVEPVQIENTVTVSLEKKQEETFENNNNILAENSESLESNLTEEKLEETSENNNNIVTGQGESSESKSAVVSIEKKQEENINTAKNNNVVNNKNGSFKSNLTIENSEETLKKVNDNNKNSENVANHKSESLEGNLTIEKAENNNEKINDNNENNSDVVNHKSESFESNLTEEKPEETSEKVEDNTKSSKNVVNNKSESSKSNDTVEDKIEKVENGEVCSEDDNKTIAELNEIIKALKEERDFVVAKFNEIVSDEDIVVDPVSMSEYKQLEDTLAEKDTQINEINKKLEDSAKKIETLKDNLKKSEKEKEELSKGNDIAEKLTEQLSDVKSSKEELETKYNNLVQSDKDNTEKINELSSGLEGERKYRLATVEILQSTFLDLVKRCEEIETITNEKNELSDKLEESNKSIKSISDEKEKQAKIISDKNDEIAKQNEKIKEQNKTIGDNGTEITKLKTELEESNQALVLKESELTQKTSEEDVLQKQITNLNTRLTAKSSECQKLSSDIVEKTKKITELETSNASLEQRAKLADDYAESEKQRAQREIDIMTAKLGLITEKLSEKEKQLEELTNKNKTTDNESDSENEDLVDTSDVSNDTLKEKLSVLSKELKVAKEENKALEKKYNESQSECRGYKDMVKSMSGDSGINGILGRYNMAPITISRQSQIFTVVGSGSHGTTSTAMSIAGKLSQTSRVLYMDFNIVTPSADAWFSKNPFCQNIPGVVNDPYGTSFGIFLEKGMTIVSSYIDRMIIPCEKTKGGQLDFFSGIYQRADSNKLVSADFSALLNIVIEKYNYIVIDLGRLGNSEANDSLIKAITDVAYRNILVTTSDKFEIRNFKMKLTNNNIRVDNSAWLINMCNSSNIDTRVLSSIKPIPYGIMAFDPEIRGTYERFFRTRTNRDNFDYFLKVALSGRK